MLYHAINVFSKCQSTDFISQSTSTMCNRGEPSRPGSGRPRNPRNVLAHKHETFREWVREMTAIPGFWQQLYTALTVSMAAFSAGNVIGWSAPMFLHLTGPGEKIVRLRKLDLSFILVCMQVSSILQMMITGGVMVRFGRKAGCCFMSVLAPCGWAFLAFAKTTTHIYIGSSLAGASMITGGIAGIIYLSETSSDRLRGPLISLQVFFNSCGILTSHILGEYMPWEYFHVACLLVSLVFPFVFWRLPESPQYLILKSRTEEAKQSLSWYHGGDAEIIETEMNKMALFKPWSARSCKSLFTDKGARRGVSITFFLAAMSELCGTSVIENYAGVIVLDTIRCPQMMAAKTASLVLAVFRFIAGPINVYMVERSGRKFTLMLSIMAMTLTLITLSIFIAMKVENSVKYWGILICLILYTLANQTFFATAEVISGEVLPAETRDMTLSIAGSIRVFTVIVAVQTYAGLSYTTKTYYNFIIESMFCLVGVVFVMYLIPETQGMTLEEIRQLLGKDDQSQEKSQTSSKSQSGRVFLFA